MVDLHPLPGRALVELGGAYQNIASHSKSYESKTLGKVLQLAVNTADDLFASDDIVKMFGELVGKTVYWQEFKEGSRILIENKEYAFINLEDIDGYATKES